jgi:acyl-CoA synthetase (AMP-forming)/AMP-acid ligase II
VLSFISSKAKVFFLTLRDRSKDVIISGESNSYPSEVEEALDQDCLDRIG